MVDIVKDVPNKVSVKEYIATLDEQTVKDCQVLIQIMEKISGHQPKIWNRGTVGIEIQKVILRM